MASGQGDHSLRKHSRIRSGSLFHEVPLSTEVLPPTATFYKKWIRPLISEFLGTICLLLTVYVPKEKDHVVVIGLVVIGLVVIFGEASGCQLNPSVTLGLTLVGDLDYRIAPLYILTQMLAGICASFIYLAMVGKTYFNEVVHGHALLQRHHVPYSTIITETFGTYILILVIIMLVVDKELGKDLSTCIIIGVVLLGLIYFCNGINGAGLNPARVFGAALVFSITHGFNWMEHNQIYYFLGEILGPLLAAFSYKYLFATRRTTWLAKRE